jgi:hypothetical protein
MSTREQRIAANEALFRDTNERIVRKNADSELPVEIICECGDRECVERLSVSLAEYEQARSDPAVFFAKPGHVEREAEDVVGAHLDHELVRKTGAAAIVAEERDPRS